ncbi:RecB family exonuclease [Chloroflexota bacterium]
MEVEEQMILENLVVKQFQRVSPSRYTAMQTCLLREVWAASGNEPLLPPSPVAELGFVIHQLLEVASRGQLDDGGKAKVEAVWDELILEIEKKMTFRRLSKHLVPLTRSISDFEVRKIRAFRRAAEIAHDALRAHDGRYKHSLEPMGFELWVENDTGQVGGYIDRVMTTEDGVVLCDYKSGALLETGTGGVPGDLKRAYKVQLSLYAALYHIKYGIWPVRLELVPLQGTPMKVDFEPKDAECLIVEASEFLHAANKRIAQVEDLRADSTDLASPQATNCRFCLFRPACHAYWVARGHESEEKWPADVQGFLREMTCLRNGKVSMRLAEDDSYTSHIATVRNLTDRVERHPFLDRIQIGNEVAIYGLEYNYHSGDYTETQNTVIYMIY